MILMLRATKNLRFQLHSKSKDFLFSFVNMKKLVFKTVAKINKLLLPSLTKRQLDMSKASKFQLALIGWRYYITKNSLD